MAEKTQDTSEYGEFLREVMKYDAHDPIDFGMLLVREEEVFDMVCRDVFQRAKLSDKEILSIVLAKTMTENLVLKTQRDKYAIDRKSIRNNR